MSLTTLNLSSSGNTNPTPLLETTDEASQIHQQLQPGIKIADVYPTTPLQDGLIALSMKNNGAFVPQIICRLPEDVDLPRFKAAWQTCVDQNDTLRTVFVQAKTTGLVQVVEDIHTISWLEHSSLETYLESDKAIVPEFGSRLVRYAIINDEVLQGTYFVWTFHHAVIDGWAMKLLLEQVDQHYHNGSCDSLVNFKIFIDHITRKMALSSKESEEFWTDFLATQSQVAFPPVSSKRQSAGSSTESSKSLDIKIPAPLQQIGTTSTIIQAAWAVLVARWGNAVEATYGMVLAGRNLDIPGIKRINGPTFMTIPFRVLLDDSQTPENFFAQIHKLRTAIKPHQHLGLQNIRRLGPGAANACSFENLLVVQPKQLPNPGSLFSKRTNTSDHWSRLNAYALMLQCDITDDGFLANASFDPNRVSPEDVELMLVNLQHIIEQFSERIHGSIGDIQLLTTDIVEDDLSMPLIETGVNLVRSCVHETISSTARNHLSDPAIESWDGKLTYQELEDATDRLAHHLRISGVGPEVMVGLMFEKGLFAAVAMVAVMKAGGVFVPLDPASPEGRLRDLINQTGLRLLLCSESLTGLSLKLASETITVNDSTLSQLPFVSGLACEDITPRNACYVIFTSGTTSKPKACVIEHGTCCTVARQLAAAYGMTSSTRMLQLSSYTFDGCILEILVTLTKGGCVCVPSQEEKMNDITGAINRLQADVAFMTPTFARLITPSSVPGLKTLILGGEKFMHDDFSRWWGDRRLFEAYGPTECCVICIVQEVKDPAASPSHIGMPIIGSYALLDDQMQQVRYGEIGELYIGGPHLARGYFGDAAKTNSAFVATPNSLKNHKSQYSRWYKTGDLIRWDVKASVFEYIGRKDTQVKLNGQRVELEEIETCLRSAMDEAADVSVVVAEPTNQKSFLAAFVCQRDNSLTVPLEDHGASGFASNCFNLSVIAAMLDSLGRRLPEYMVPKVYIPLDSMPLMTSGKLNRKLLQSYASGLSSAERAKFSGQQAAYAHPVGDKEMLLQDVWTKILNIKPEAISRNDSFIRLGGDSILAMKLVAMARQRKLQVSVADVFRSPVLSELAKISRFLDCERVSETDVIPPFQLLPNHVNVRSLLQDLSTQGNVEVSDLYPCTQFQQGIMALSLNNIGTYVAQHVFELSKAVTDNKDKFCAAWEAVVAATPILRTKIVQTDTCGLLQAVFEERISWEHHDDLESFLKKDKANPFGLGTQLSRYAIVTSSPVKSYFVWTMHHACYDGWSLRLTLQDVELQYKSMMSAKRQVPGVRLPFNRFVKSLQNLDEHEAEKFWQADLGHGEPSSFPSTTSGYSPQPSSTFEHTIAFKRKPQSGLRPSSLIRAAWAMTISTYANTDDVVFGATLSGRTGSSPDLAHIVGPVITTVPVRIRLDPQMLILDYLRGVALGEVDAMPFEQFGLSRIRLIDESVKAACDFQNLLIIQPKQEANADGSFLGPRLRKYINADVFDTYALTMECAIQPDEIGITAIYDPLIVKDAQMRRVVFHFEHVLSQLCQEDGAKSIADVNSISPSDAIEIQKWNAAIPQPMDSCVHHIVEQRMMEEPGAPAICSWDGEFSRGDLSRESSLLALKLVGLGIGTGSKVPLLFQKSKWAIVSILAIMKAGAAFVPLDPRNPATRLVSIVNQLDAKLCLCSLELESMCSASFPGIRILAIDGPSTACIAEAQQSLQDVNSKSDLYLIFTSGTTGVPKGVAVQHGAYCAGARDHAKALGFEKSSRFLQFASYSFDTSVEDILTTLMTGGCLCIPSEEERSSDIVGAIARMKVNTADLTPSFISSISPDDVPSLRRLILGGEPLNSKVIKTWANRVHLINGYGVSECCVTSLVNSNVSPETSPANIGRAVGAASWIVDASNSNRLLPIGAIGELLIEGPAIARGYLNDPERTRASFNDGARWQTPCVRAAGRHYKTGDLVQYNSDGTINYVGRKDAQIKIRGQRIELADIEFHLADHPEVRNAQALLPVNGPYKGSITALIELENLTCTDNDRDIKLVPFSEMQAAGIDWSRIADHLRAKLPSYMVPSEYLFIKKLPLHTSGKLDRSRLSVWLQSLPARRKRYETAPRTKQVISEEDSVAIDLSGRIASMFGDDKVRRNVITGYDARLSDIGFDSIRMMSLAAIIKRAYGVSIPMSVLIDHQIRISDLAEHIKVARQGVTFEQHLSVDLMLEFKAFDKKLQTFEQRIGVVFLTGATGFLGIQILRQLLKHPGVEKVIAHVRARNSEEALKRLESSAKSAKWSLSRLDPRIEAWHGDLSKPLLGLSTERWAALANMDAIVHNGASVNWSSDFHKMKATNVNSTLQLLEAVYRAGPSIKFVYVTGGRSMDDNEPLESAFSKLSKSDGYSQTKFLSEALVKTFARRQQERGANPHIQIVEPGLIMGTGEEGVANTTDFVWRYVAGAVRVGMYPEAEEDDWLEITGADVVARTIVGALLQCSATPGFKIKMTDGISMRDFWELVVAASGHDLRPISPSEWKTRIQMDIEKTAESHPLWPVAHLIEAGGNFGKRRGRADAERLADASLKATVRRNIEFLSGCGFLGGCRRGNVV
ncbi:Nonribosomal Peptide Synthase (NRPS) [Venturia inaequalis]|uniref:Nonribosomal Peptide Synthase (NRPS) n=1 Tax=Venturia inaequalis TaxID=5025 RepID=A0A8H3UII1_VENIN|nr:Nonribosomal Peptide Synthase (NRPS) [Venturia inaequalis]